MRIRAAVVCALVLFALPTIARVRHTRIVPKVYDPTHSGSVFSSWLPLSRERALWLVKDAPTLLDAAAGAIVEGVDGRTLDGLAFDVLDFGHCGNGAPRFDVTTADGTVYFFGCYYGTHRPADERGFTNVRFSDADAQQQYMNDPPWPGFGRAQVQSVEIVFDEGIDQGNGFAVLDDIEVATRR